VLRLIREVLFFEPEGRGTSIRTALEYLGKVTKRRSVVFLVSDFLDEGYDHALRVVGKRHDLIPVVISDPREHTIPAIGLIELMDPESGDRFLVDTSDATSLEAFHQKVSEQTKAQNQAFIKAGVDSIPINTGKSYVEPLVRFFKMRERRLSR